MVTYEAEIWTADPEHKQDPVRRIMTFEARCPTEAATIVREEARRVRAVHTTCGPVLERGKDGEIIFHDPAARRKQR